MWLCVVIQLTITSNIYMRRLDFSCKKKTPNFIQIVQNRPNSESPAGIRPDCPTEFARTVRPSSGRRYNNTVFGLQSLIRPWMKITPKANLSYWTRRTTYMLNVFRFKVFLRAIRLDFDRWTWKKPWNFGRTLSGHIFWALGVSMHLPRWFPDCPAEFGTDCPTVPGFKSRHYNVLFWLWFFAYDFGLRWFKRQNCLHRRDKEFS